VIKIGETFTRSIKVFSNRDRRNLLLVTLIQIFMGLLDLVAVALIGVLGALAVNGVQSKEPGNRVSKVLELLAIQDLTFQKQVTVIGLLAGFMMIGRTAISIIFTRRTLFFLSKKAADISSQLVKKLLMKEILFVQKRSSQQNLFAVTSGVNHITVGIVGTLITLISDISLLLVLSVGLFVLDPIIAFSTFGMFLLIALALYLLMQKRARHLGEENSNLQVDSNEDILEALDTFRELTVRGRKPYYSEKISIGRMKLARNTAEMAFMPNIGKYVIETAVVFGALVVAAIQFLTQDATRAVGTLSVFLAAGSRIAPAVLRMQQGAINVRSSMASAQPTLILMDELNGQNFQIKDEGIPTENRGVEFFAGEVRIDNISFTYPGSDTAVISDLTLQIPSGHSVALVGPSGAGKSTLADLILGVIKPDTGSVLISKQSPEEAVRNFPGVLAYVPQSIKIINATVKENICLGFDLIDYSDEVVWNCLEKAQLKDFIENLPMKLHNLVGEGGSKFSGGQRQRLGIARALLTNPQVLVLDEATSALDGKTESEITNAIQLLKGEVTVITIAHRLSTVANSDLVVYIDNGKILATGNFQAVESMVPEFAEQASLLKR
jgi:ATP-binding cassette subfamily C protein